MDNFVRLLIAFMIFLLATEVHQHGIDIVDELHVMNSTLKELKSAPHPN